MPFGGRLFFEPYCVFAREASWGRQYVRAPGLGKPAFSAPTGQRLKAQRCPGPPGLRWVPAQKWILKPNGFAAWMWRAIKPGTTPFGVEDELLDVFTQGSSQARDPGL